MKTNTNRSFRPLTLTAVASLALAVSAPRVRAAFTFTLQQVGADVVITGGGTLNTTALTLTSTTFTTGYPRIYPGFGVVFCGASGSTESSYTGAAGPGSFQSVPGGQQTNATSGSGANVGIVGDGTLYVPTGYVSGSLLSDTSTYANTTVSGLGFTPGTYTYTWGTGANADSLTVTSVVPEPSTTWTLLSLGGAGGFGLTLRRRRSRRAA